MPNHQPTTHIIPADARSKPRHWRCSINGKRSHNGARIGFTIEGTLNLAKAVDSLTVIGLMHDIAEHVRTMTSELAFADSFQLTVLGEGEVFDG